LTDLLTQSITRKRVLFTTIFFLVAIFAEVWKAVELFTAWLYNLCFYSAIITITL